jgi:hypothetical protein
MKRYFCILPLLIFIMIGHTIWAQDQAVVLPTKTFKPKHSLGLELLRINSYPKAYGPNIYARQIQPLSGILWHYGAARLGIRAGIHAVNWNRQEVQDLPRVNGRGSGKGWELRLQAGIQLNILPEGEHFYLLAEVVAWRQSLIANAVTSEGRPYLVMDWQGKGGGINVGFGSKINLAGPLSLRFEVFQDALIQRMYYRDNQPDFGYFGVSSYETETFLRVAGRAYLMLQF